MMRHGNVAGGEDRLPFCEEVIFRDVQRCLDRGGGEIDTCCSATSTENVTVGFSGPGGAPVGPTARASYNVVTGDSAT